MCALLGNLSPRKYYDEPVKKPYRKLIVDAMPVIRTLERLNYKQLITDSYKSTGKPQTPVKRKKASTIPDSMACPKCGAPHDYLYG